MNRTLIEPGMYPNMPAADYFALDAVNHSSLREFARCPAAFKHCWDHPEEDSPTPAKLLGTLTHAKLFEPAAVEERFALGPANPKSGKCYGVETKAWTDAQACTKATLVTEDMMIDSDLMVEGIRRNPAIGDILAREGQREVVIVWKDDETGILVKQRMDFFGPGLMGLDLKTTQDASPEGFAKSLFNYGYHTQMALYEMGLKVYTGAPHQMAIAAVESAAPHLTAVYTLGNETLSLGISTVRGWLRQLARCREACEYPAFSTEVQEIEAPRWALKQAV